MSLKNISNFYDSVYHFLGYRNIERSEHIDKLIDECITEIEQISQFKYVYTEFDYNLDFIENNPIYKKFLIGATSYYLVLTTLGKKIDDRCRYYSKIDLEKMVIFDSTSSAYLEYMADKFESEHFDELRTYRFAPGYQGTETKDIREIAKYINFTKNGVSILESNLMVPMKSMCGIIGLGITKKMTCGDCVLKSKCEYRKGGKTCY